jgi:hypothetical protein
MAKSHVTRIREKWLPSKDSNLDSRRQRPLSYHWTTGEHSADKTSLPLRILRAF